MVIHRRISNFLYSNNLARCQLGFRPQSSTQEALHMVTRSCHQLLAHHRPACSLMSRRLSILCHMERFCQLFLPSGSKGNLFVGSMTTFGTGGRGWFWTVPPRTRSLSHPECPRALFNIINLWHISENASLILYTDDILFKPIVWMEAILLCQYYSDLELSSSARSQNPVIFKSRLVNYALSYF